MKAGRWNQVSKDFENQMPDLWGKHGKEFRRREGDWVQIVSFQTSRFSEEYIPRNCLEFLKAPGPPVGSHLPQELLNSKGTQRWVRFDKPASEVYSEMVKQFKPDLGIPFSSKDVIELLKENLDYWRHSYTLCVICTEKGDKVGAVSYFEKYLSNTSDKPYDWVDERRTELLQCINLMETPNALAAHLLAIEAQKLRDLNM